MKYSMIEKKVLINHEYWEKQKEHKEIFQNGRISNIKKNNLEEKDSSTEYKLGKVKRL